MKIGFMEIVVILIVALLVIGPDKFPEYAKKFGKAMKEFKKASSEISNDIKEEVVEPLEDLQKPFKEAVQPITDLNKEVQDNLSGVAKSFNDIGKVKTKTESSEGAKVADEPVVENVQESPAPADDSQEQVKA